MKFVIDASLLIDSFSLFDKSRRELALKVFDAIKTHELYAPKLCQVEFVSVLRRFTPEDKVRRFMDVFDFMTLVGESEFFEDALEFSFKIHSRAADSYYISTSKILNATLLTNDRKMAENARKAGIKAFYLVEEAEKFFKSLEVGE
ncbi:type II toxin-antitoxin system VapC family toxin [Thermococcus sp.]